jgi:hypothetical protein
MTERRVTLQIVKPLEAIGRRQAQGHTVVNRIHDERASFLINWICPA